MKVLFLPQTIAYKGNPYWENLQRSLEKEGVEFVSPDDKYFLEWRWIIDNRNKVNVIHLHHIEHHYRASGRLHSIIILLKFIAKLILARLLGYRIVWTVHNICPHENPKYKRINFIAYFLSTQLSNAIIVHCDFARISVKQKYLKSRGVYVIPHPNYIGSYSNSIPPQEAKSLLGVKNYRMTLLYFGNIRQYKGIDKLLEVFQSLPDKDIGLIIAGKPWDTEISRNIIYLSQSNNRIHLFLEFIPDDDVQLFFNAADFVVLPFTNVLSSGSALLAMSFRRPLIAPAIGCLIDLISPDGGILYDPENSNGLRNAIVLGMQSDIELMGMCAYEKVKSHDFHEMALKTLSVYKGEECT